MYVISSDSKISHDLSDKVYALRKPTLPGDCFVASLPSQRQKTNLASSFGGSVGVADDRGLYVILSVSEISHRVSIYFAESHPPGRLLRRFASLAKTVKKCVILSVSEISHDQGEKVYARQFFGGILHFVQNDVFFLLRHIER